MDRKEAEAILESCDDTVIQAAEVDSTKFAEWLQVEGYTEYEGVGSWIAPYNSLQVYTTKQLYKLYKQ